jgi:uncharacterized membrane protein YraQ (UPF0718 family)
MLILLTAANSVERLWPYVVGGIGVAMLLSRVARGRRWSVSSWLPWPLTTLLAATVGIASPMPTMGMVPVMLQLQAEGLPAGAVLAFIMASSLMNPQLFLLTLGALGVRFALAQLVSVLVLSAGLGLALGGGLRATRMNGSLAGNEQQWSSRAQLVDLAAHVGLYFLVGVIAGASLQVLLSQLGVLGWLGDHGLLSTPALGWLGAPLYTCGGTAVSLASSLVQTGFSHGAMFAFLLVGPALRGTTLSTLACLLPKRMQVVCLVTLALGGGLLGYGFDWLAGVI